jgi:hypothetical protein
MDTIPAELAAQLRGMSDSGGWLPPRPQWWGEDELAELLPDAEARRRFAAGCPQLPLAMFQKVHPPPLGWPQAPGAYLLLSEAYQQEAERARGLGWPVSKLASHHLGPRPARKAANRSSTTCWRRIVCSALPASRNAARTRPAATLASASPIRITSAFSSGMNEQGDSSPTRACGALRLCGQQHELRRPCQPERHGRAHNPAVRLMALMGNSP